MTILETTESDATSGFERVALDLYRDIHKGIRAELFGVTGDAGCLDPADLAGRADLAVQWHGVAATLRAHAEHEDGAIQPAIEAHLPALAERIAADHDALERRIDWIGELLDEAVDVAPIDQRPTLHRGYVELASFTSAYLEHQDVEERVVMPALERAIGPEAVVAIHQAIIGAIPPDEMATSLAFMLPAMNLDDRAELLGGMRAGAPAEVFAGVWSLAGSVLAPSDRAALGERLGLS